MDKKESLKRRILAYMKASYGYDPNNWVGGFTIEDFAKENGYMGSTSTRLLRQLAEEEILETRLFRGNGRTKLAYYRWKKEKESIIDYYTKAFNQPRV